MGAQGKPVSPFVVLAVVAIFTLPFPLALVLNFLRPDLMKPVLDHAFGYAMVLVIALLTGAGLIVALFVVTAKQEQPGLQVGISIGAFLLCTVPALFLVLFGPIVFAFVFGDVGR